MIWPFEALATMPGPRFLLLYAGVIALTLGVCYWLTRELDPTGALPPPAVPSEPDLHEIAYLRGGENELTRLMIFALIERGYLQVRGEQREQHLTQAPDHPARAALSARERLLFDWFTAPRAVEEIFQPDGPVAALDEAAPYRQRLEAEQLFTGQEARRTARRLGLTGVSLLVGLAGFKLLAASAEGHTDVGLLLALGFGSVAALYAICRPPRLSQRGRKYLETLRTALGLHPGERFTRAAGQVSPAALLLFALFGVAALQETPYAYAGELFRQSASSSFSLTSSAGCGSCGGCDGCGGCGGCGD